MEGMEDKLSAILGNPEMMSQIMAMAQNFNQAQTSQNTPPPQQEQPDTRQSTFSGGPDAAMMQKIISAAQHSGVDKNQQLLLKALAPYLSGYRIQKLEKAMRAAKMASFAAAALGGSGGLFQTGR